MPSGNRKKNILEDLFSLVLSHSKKKEKKYHPPENLKFNYLGIFRSLKLSISMGKKLPISLKLNFTPSTLSYYGLSGSFRRLKLISEEEGPCISRGIEYIYTIEYNLSRKL